VAEFTGERMIPGLVNADLFNEHLARYRFAARFIEEGDAVLDAGCGSGYGVAEFGNAASIIAADISADAIRHARENFSRPGIAFLQAACEHLPFADASFDLVASFEVVEHLTRWSEFLEEAGRVLKPSGVFLVSTPNKRYYAESRAGSGPNPFHCHEFEFEEFQSALYAVFPHVRIWTQNHNQAIVFAPPNPGSAALEATGDPSPEQSHFYLAACSHAEIAANEVFAWVPSAGNALREREHHIAKLEGEIEKKDAWLGELTADHSTLQSAHETTLAELRASNDWAARLNAQLKEREARIGELQDEADVRLQWIGDMEARIGELRGEIERGAAEIDRLNIHRGSLEADLAARAAWGQSLNAELRERSAELAEVVRRLDEAAEQLRQLHDERQLIAASKWMRLGRKLNLGPVVSGE